MSAILLRKILSRASSHKCQLPSILYNRSWNKARCYRLPAEFSASSKLHTATKTISMEGSLYTYNPKSRLPLFSHKNGSPGTPADLVLLFVGGMYDSFVNVAYTSSLADLFATSPTTRLIHIEMTSSHRQFGFGSISRDVSEIALAIQFIRFDAPKLGHSNTKIILLGHSTGCQDVLSFLSVDFPKSKVQDRPKVQGAILQAPVSDRDGLTNAISSPDQKALYDKCLHLYQTTPDAEKPTTFLPMHWTTAFFGPAPMSLSRFHSLASPNSPSQPADDDMFSVDCTDTRLQSTFGRAVSNDTATPLEPSTTGPKKRTLGILISGSDEFYTPTVDRHAFIPRWKTIIEDAGGELHSSSGVIAHAKHGFEGDDVEARWAREVELRRRVLGYIKDVTGREEGEAERVVEEGEKRLREERGKESDEQVEEVERGVSGAKI